MDFRILGELEVLVDGEPIALGSPRQRALLLRLLVSRSESVSTDRLLEDLWRGEPRDNARHTLHVYVSRLRKALGAEGHRLERQGSGYRLAVSGDELDAGRFEQLAAEGRHAMERSDPQAALEMLNRALNEWRGPALTGFDDDTFAYDEAVRLEELRLAAIEQRLWAQLELGRHAAVTGELQDLVARYPLRETLWEQTMLALYRSGRQAEALRVYQTARTTLAKEIGIEPGPALRSLEQQILSQDPALDHATDRREKPTPVLLPLQRTSFVGRTAELDLGGRLLAESRLVTLLGPPGSGKTRLAIELAQSAADRNPHGVFFVPLAEIKEPDLLGEGVAAAVGIADIPGESQLTAVKRFFADRRCLLVLDNFEHLVDAASDVGEILDVAPEVTILATSRAPLRVSGEQRFPVLPMRVPTSLDDIDPTNLESYDSIALFATRAKAADPSFEIDSGNLADVVDVIGMVDGLPLAIELAAARTAILHPSELRSRLQKRMSILSEGPTDVTDRHRTMRDAIAWSYELLEPEEQKLFRGLGVFVGGFTLDAAETISELDPSRALSGIESLLNQNLLHRPVTVGPARFTMLELSREFAVERLAAEDELEEATKRHAEFFVELAATTEPELTQDPGGTGARRLEDEVANIRSVLRYCLDSDQPDLGLALAASIWRFWQGTERLTEGRRWLDEFLAHPMGSPEARAKGKDALAGLAYWQADYECARNLYEELLAFQRSIDDKAGEAETLFALSLTVNWQGDTAAGQKYAFESLELFESIGHLNGIGRAKCAVASTYWWDHEYEKAYELWMESVEISRQQKDHALLLTQRAGQAALTHHLGRDSEALEVAVAGLAEALVARNTHVTVWMLDLIAAFAAPIAPVDAVLLSGAADALRTAAGGGVLPEYLEIVEARTTALDQVDAATVAKAWRQGHELELEEAVALADRLGALAPGLPTRESGPRSDETTALSANQ